MEVILLENISNLGGLGDKVNVRAGFGRNYLVPKGKAVPATASNVADFEVRRAELEAAAAATLAAAEARAETINALGLISIPANAGEEGKLFGSIGTRDIADAVTAAGCEVVACLKAPCANWASTKSPSRCTGTWLRLSLSR